MAKRQAMKKKSVNFVPAANNRLPEKNLRISFIYVYDLVISLFLQLMKPYTSKKKNIVKIIVTEK